MSSRNSKRTRMHSSRMCTACSLTVSHRILCMPPTTMHAPLPLQPCMPPATTHAPHNHKCHLQPCTPPATTHPPTTHAPQQPCMPPATMHSPQPLPHPATPPPHQHGTPPHNNTSPPLGTTHALSCEQNDKQV